MGSTVDVDKTAGEAWGRWAPCLLLSLGLHAVLVWGFWHWAGSMALPSRPRMVTFTLVQAQSPKKPLVKHQASLHPGESQVLKPRLSPAETSRPSLKVAGSNSSLKPPQASPAKQVQASLTQKPVPVTGNHSALVQPAASALAVPSVNSAIPAMQASEVAENATASTRSTTTATSLAVSDRLLATSIAAKSAWQGRLISRLERYKRYPRSARELKQEGLVQLRFALNRRGKVLSSRIEKSSGVDALDRETLALIHRAEPLPPPPLEIPGESIEFVVPVQFLLK